MAKSISVQLGQHYFAKKEDVRVKIREMIKSYPVMGYLEGSDKELCLLLFKHHPSANVKIGVGIKEIQVRLDDYGKRFFYLYRNDNTEDDISWPKCLNSIK